MFDIKFYEAFQEEEKIIRKNLPKNLKASFTSKTVQESSEKIPPANLISIRTQSNIPSSWLKHLKGILTRSQGYDHLTSIARDHQDKIQCGYLGCYCDQAVADHAILMMHMLLRKIKKQIKHFDSFNREDITGREYHSHHVLVIGVGNIGEKIVRELKRLKMSVQGVDLVPRLKNLNYVSLKKGIQSADIVFCALPLTEKTRGLLNYNIFKNAGKNKYLINVSRGEITPIADLKKMLDQNILAGLSLDVYENESEIAEYLRNPQKRKGNKNIQNVLNLKNHDHVIFTPHNAFNTEQALQEKCRLTVQEAVRFLKTKQFRWKV